MFKRFRSKRVKQKDQSERGEAVESSKTEVSRSGLSKLLLSVPSSADSISQSHDSSASLHGIGLHVIHQPDFVDTDIVFIHGLGGHSQKTWSNNHDPSYFWPQLWLPYETGIGSSRIFTFGYNADWRGATKSISNITDFAKELLFEMRFGKASSGQDLNLGTNPILFVVHSMGGLVAKKAYLLGLHDTNYQEIVQAVSAIVFLSTPHRGTHLAGILNKVLAASFQSPKNFISDLNKDSTAIEELNEQFRHVAPRLSIWSFYETLATSIGPRKVMVLEKDSSVLGYPAEISRPLQADHHSVCKYSSPTDSNYVAVRNAITSLVTRYRALKPQALAGAAHAGMTKDESVQIEDLFRDCPSSEADYNAIRRSWIPGTCEWFLEEKEFLSWLIQSTSEPAVLWYNAPPATGKSVLSTFVINHLRSKGLPCQFFLFKYSDAAKRSVANCIKSLALQLSTCQRGFSKLLANSSQESLGLDSSNPSLIWRNVIEGILFKSNLTSPVYWVIDALDECDDHKIFFECLKSFGDRKIAIRILILSRNTDTISINFDRLSRTVSGSRIEKSTKGHNQKDIELLAQRELDHMRGSSDFRQQLLQDIMKRSEGNFLWVKLVLEELMGCHTEENIRGVLEEMPDNMTLMFQRMEENLVKSTRRSEKPLIRVLLEWSNCAQRPLSLKELSQALEPEFSGFLDLKRTIQETCGQFVQVDSDEKVSLIHYSAREYFTRTPESVFFIDATRSHEKLFMRALAVFEDEDLRWRLLQNQDGLQKSEPFTFYSAVNWPFHLSRSASSSSECLDVLMRAFRGLGVLTWIYVLGVIRRLEVLVEASKVLATFVRDYKKLSASQSPVLHRFSDLELLNEWMIDLTKLVGRFASHIVARPRVVYDIIPAVCPPKSITHKQFHKSAKIKVAGHADESWNDRLCQLSLPSEVQAWRIACTSKYLAVLGSDGVVYVWDTSNFGEVSVIRHGEPVTAFALSGNGGTLCTYGLKRTKLWSTFSGGLLSSTENPPYTKAMTLVFAENDRKLIMGGDDNIIRYIACDDIPRGWEILDHNLLKETAQVHGAIVNSPVCLAFNGDKTQVGVSYRGAPLSVWRLRDGQCINRCRRVNDLRNDKRQPSSNWFGVKRFTWNRVTGHIIGIYRDGTILKWHPLTDENIETNWTGDEVAVSPNGKLFATSSSNGSVHIWDFGRFRVIYQLSSESLVTDLAFSPDSRQFYDLRDVSINAWEPHNLTSFAENNEKISNSNVEDQSSTTPWKVADGWFDQREAVTALSVAPDGCSYCLGYEDGNVKHYRKGATDGTVITRFCNHMPVTNIRWSPDGRLVACSDLAGDIDVRGIVQNFEDGAVTSTALPQPQIQKNDHNIEDMTFSLDGKFILIITTESVFVCSTEDGKLAAQSHVAIDSHGKWLHHPAEADKLLLCNARGIKAYQWDTLEIDWSVVYSDVLLETDDETAMSGTRTLNPQDFARIALTQENKAAPNVMKAMITQDSFHVLLYTSKATGSKEFDHHYLSVVPTKALDGNKGINRVHPLPDAFSVPTDIVSHILVPLGVLPGRRLVFIDHDLWLCSYILTNHIRSTPLEAYNRFYFIPRDWVTRDSLEQCVLADDGTLFFPKGDRVVLIECSLDETRPTAVF